MPRSVPRTNRSAETRKNQTKLDSAFQPPKLNSFRRRRFGRKPSFRARTGYTRKARPIQINRVKTRDAVRRRTMPRSPMPSGAPISGRT